MVCFTQLGRHIPIGGIMDFDLRKELSLIHKGKVRETYGVPGREGLLLIVASNRISTHNVVHESTIPNKGEVLTALTLFWLTHGGPLSHLSHHVVASGFEIYNYIPKPRYPMDLASRAMVVQELSMVPTEFIYRSYLTGSLKKSYLKKQDPYGLGLPEGLIEMDRFPQGIVFTPTRKSKNDPSRKMRNTTRQYPVEALLGMHAYVLVSEFLRSKGITLVDSKIEMGEKDGIVHLADELFTPDSSRFVDTKDVRVGVVPPWLDKQIARDEAERIWQGTSGPPLSFSQETIDRVSETYRWLLTRITGMSLETWKKRRRFDYHA